MNRYLRFREIPVPLLLLILGATFLSFSMAPQSVSAVAPPTHELVIIAVDATKKGCTETFKANVNTAHPSIAHTLCPAGTSIATELVPLTQATQMQVPYVVPADAQASAEDKQAKEQEIHTMMQKAGKDLLSSSTKTMVLPFTACGNTGTYVVNWDPEGGVAYTSVITFVREKDSATTCNTAYFQTAQITVNSFTYCEYYWVNDLYAGNYYSVPGQPTLSTVGHSYSHGVHQSAPTGYYYENFVSELASAPGCNNGYSYYINIGPLS